MPTILITCHNCGNEEETTTWNADNFTRRGLNCNNDACSNCASKEDPEYHPECYRDFKEGV